MNVAVLMTCHNRREKTLRCLRSLKASFRFQVSGFKGQIPDFKGQRRLQNLAETVGLAFHRQPRTAMERRPYPQLPRQDLGLEVRVFLVDDGSTDGTGEAVRNVGIWEYGNEKMGKCENGGMGECGNGGEWVNVIRGNGNLFWAKGMRLAWETAVEEEKKVGAFDAFLWLNDDVELKSGAIESVLDDWRVCGDERGVIVGACARDVEETASTYAATTRRDVQIPPNGKAPQQADGWFNGNFVLVPRKAYEQVGMISNEYTHARADYDYAERLKRAGIPFFASSRYVGVCEKDYARKVAGMGFLSRVELLWKPGYSNLHDLFLFRRKYYGLMRALISCLHMTLIVLRPLGR